MAGLEGLRLMVETRQEIPAGVHIKQYEPQIKGQLKNWSRAISEVKWQSLLNNWI